MVLGAIVSCFLLVDELVFAESHNLDPVHRDIAFRHKIGLNSLGAAPAQVQVVVSGADFVRAYCCASVQANFRFRVARGILTIRKGDFFHVSQ